MKAVFLKSAQAELDAAIDYYAVQGLKQGIFIESSIFLV